jgi:CDP-diglyceride synthetase
MPIIIFGFIFFIIFLVGFELYKKNKIENNQKPLNGATLITVSLVIGWGVLFLLLWAKSYEFFFFYLVVLLFYTLVAVIATIVWLDKENRKNEKIEED